MSSAFFEPLVSVVIPVYNGSKYLSQAIDSVLNQSYKRIEIIVVNDGSRDGGLTEQVAKSYSGKIKYLTKTNGGVASALNVAIKEAHGDYISWLSHDDLYYPDKIERQIYYLQMTGQIKLILYSDFEEIDEHGRHLADHRMYKVGPGNFRIELLWNSFVHGCSLLIPREYFSRGFLFNENLRTTQDYDLWFRMCEHYKFVHMSEILIKSRAHSGQGIRKLRTLHLQEANELYIKYMDLLTDDEIFRWKGQTRCQFFAHYAHNLQKRNLKQAKWHALSLSLKSYSGYYQEPKKDILRNTLRSILHP